MPITVEATTPFSPVPVLAELKTEREALIDNLKTIYFVKQDRRLGKQFLLRKYLFVFYFDSYSGRIKKLTCFDFLKQEKGESFEEYKKRYMVSPTPPFIKFTKNEDLFAFSYDIDQEDGFEKLKNDILFYLNVDSSYYKEYNYEVL